MTCVNHKIHLTLVFQFAFSLVSFVLHITFIPVFLFNNQALKMKRVLLPLELIIQILLRLPVKSLVRFKCVCKSWLSLISDPHFATSHFELAAALRERVLFLDLSDAPVIRSIDLNASLHDDSASATLNLNFLLPEPNICQIIGSCRGFVVLDCYQSLWVWNPSTCVHKQVPCSPIASDVNGLFCTFVYGFGYDSSTDDYLIVQMSYNPNSDYRTCVEVFSLRANLWKEIEGIHLSYINCCDDIKIGSLLNDAIHWPVFDASQDVSKDVVVAFDLMERTFSEIPLPVDFGCEFNDCDLRVLGEFLSLCIVGCYDPAEIWVMKEYKVQSSWTKTVVVSVDYIPSKCFSVICSTKCGDIVGSDGIAGLVKCNDEGQLHEHRSYTRGLHGNRVSVYVESLLSLP